MVREATWGCTARLALLALRCKHQRPPSPNRSMLTTRHSAHACLPSLPGVGFSRANGDAAFLQVHPMSASDVFTLTNGASSDLFGEAVPAFRVSERRSQGQVEQQGRSRPFLQRREVLVRLSGSQVEFGSLKEKRRAPRIPGS